MANIIISELNIYPVKSLAQISLQRSLLDRFGLHMDRRWMLIDEHGKMLTQRQLPRMCLIQTQLNKQQLSLSASDMDTLHVAPAMQTLYKVQIWNDHCDALDCGDEAAEWLSFFLNKECRLVYFPEQEVRQVDPNYAQAGDNTAFSDGFPLLLISQASLDDLNQRLETPVSMARFRPNIVISGCEAFAEDDWKTININHINFRIVKPCSRCVIPSIDIKTAQKQPIITQTLSQYRMHDQKIFFGQNVIAEGTGELKVGMEITLL